jgi:hydroxyacylglutathione hydrolase
VGGDPFPRCYGLAVLIERSMHPDWLSNAYLLADERGGTAVFVDSGAPLEPLHEVVEREGLHVTHLLTTHSHPDHVAGDGDLVERYGLEIVKGPVTTGGLRIEALETPGHADDHLAFVANETVAFTADILFKDAVGGGPDAAPIRASVMDVLMALPPETRVLPGHTDETTIGREWEENPFVLYWRGEAPSIDEAVRVGGEDATLVVWSPDYDGKGKAMVRFGDGREAIIGGSRVER